MFFPNFTVKNLSKIKKKLQKHAKTFKKSKKNDISTGSSFPADYPKTVPLAVVSLDGR